MEADQKRKKISGFGTGDFVQIERLRKATQYNRAHGYIGLFFEDSGRYEVKLQPPFTGRRIKVPVTNLIKCFPFLALGTPEIMELCKKFPVLQNESRQCLAEGRLGRLRVVNKEIVQILNHPDIKRLNLNFALHQQSLLLMHNGCLDEMEPFEEFKRKCFSIIDEATCPHIKVETLNTFCDKLMAYDVDEKDHQEALQMLRRNLKSHYGNLCNVAQNIGSILFRLRRFKEAWEVFAEYIPKCRNMHVVDQVAEMEMVYADRFVHYIRMQCFWEHPGHEECEGDIVGEDVLFKGKQIVDKMKLGFATTEFPNIRQQATIWKVEAEFIRLSANYQSSNFLNNPLEIERQFEVAIRLYEKAGDVYIQREGIQSVDLFKVYDGISQCCYFLGDMKNARKFSRKANRNRGWSGAEKDLHHKHWIDAMKNKKHVRDVTISFGDKRLCCYPECDNFGAKYCSKCKRVQYCSKKCQKKHFKAHKRICKSYINS